MDFNLVQTATVSFHGIGGLTVPRLARELRLLFVNEPLPRVIILEIGTNDLSSQSPEVVIGEVLDLVDYLGLLHFIQVSFGGFLPSPLLGRASFHLSLIDIELK